MVIITNSFSDFVGEVTETDGCSRFFATIFFGLYYFIPSVHVRKNLIYVPAVYKPFRGLYAGFLRHETLHIEHPDLSEAQIERLSRCS